MNCWEELGIKPTMNKRDIKIAYTDKLKFCRPDKDPEGFKKLRKAYEEAVKQSHHLVEADLIANKANEVFVKEEQPNNKENLSPIEINTQDITTVDLLAQALTQLYYQVEKRHIAEYWKALFSSPISLQLDKHTEVEDCMISFFCYHNLLPIDILDLFSSYYKFEQEFARLEQKEYFDKARYLYYYLQSYDTRIPYPTENELPTDNAEVFIDVLKNRRRIEDSKIFENASANQLLNIYRQEKRMQKDDVLKLYLSQELIYDGSFNEAINVLNENNTQLQNNETNALLGDCYYHIGDYDSALNYYQKHAKNMVNTVPISTIKGIALCMLKLHQDETACELMAQVLAKTPYDFELRIHLNRLLAKLIEKSEQEEDLELSTKLAYMLFDAGLYDDALEFAKPDDTKFKLWELYKKSGKTDTIAAKCYARLGKYDRANKAFEKVLKETKYKNENIFDIIVEYTLYCNYHFERGPILWITTDFKEFVKIAEYNAEYAYVAAILYDILPDYSALYRGEDEFCHKQALHFIEIATQSDPQNAHYQLQHSYFMYDQKNYKEAIKSGTIARTLYSTDYVLNYNISFAYFHEQNFQKAIRFIEYTLSLNPDDYNTYRLMDALAKSYAVFGHSEKTIHLLQQLMNSGYAMVNFALPHLNILVEACKNNGIEIPLLVSEFIISLLSHDNKLNEIPEPEGTKEYALEIYGVLDKNVKKQKELDRRTAAKKEYAQQFLSLIKLVDQEKDRERLMNEFNELTI